MNFIYGFVVGAVTVMCWNGSWFLFDELADRIRRPSREAAEDQAIALTVEPTPCPGCGERCDVCEERMCSEYGPEPAITCDAHRVCVGCDDASNTCSGCAERRAIARTEASA